MPNDPNTLGIISPLNFAPLSLTQLLNNSLAFFELPNGLSLSSCIEDENNNPFKFSSNK